MAAPVLRPEVAVCADRMVCEEHSASLALRAEGEELVAEPPPERRALEGTDPAASTLAEQRSPLELDGLESRSEQPLQAARGQWRDVGRIVAETTHVTRPDRRPRVVQPFHRIVRRRERQPAAQA